MYRITDDRQQQCLEKFLRKKNMVSRLFRVQICGIYDVFCGIIGWLFPYQAEWVSIHESMKTYGIYAMIYLLGFSFTARCLHRIKAVKEAGISVKYCRIYRFRQYRQRFLKRKDIKNLWQNRGDCGSGTDIFAIVALHTFSIGNILIPLAVLYVLPAGICAVEIAVELWKGQTPVRFKRLTGDKNKVPSRTFIYKLCGFLRSFIDNINADTYKKQCGNTAKAQRIFFAKQHSG